MVILAVSAVLVVVLVLIVMRPNAEERFKKKLAASPHRLLLEHMLQASAKGRFTEADRAALSSEWKASGATDEDLLLVRQRAFRSAFLAVKNSGSYSSANIADLVEIQEFLKIPNDEVSAERAELAHANALIKIQSGNFGNVDPGGVILQKDEQAIWKASGSLLEERVVDRKYEGRSAGVSIHVVKGVTFRTGSQRGHLVSVKGVIPVSQGHFLVTSRRAIFSGTTKSVTAKLEKIVDIEPYSDGVRFSVEGRKDPVFVKFDTGTGDLVVAALHYAIDAAR